MLVPRLKTQNQCPSSFIPPFVSYLNGNPKLSCWTGTKLTIWLPDGWTFKHPNVECSNKSCELFFILTSFIYFLMQRFIFFPKKRPRGPMFFFHHDFQALWIGDLTLLLSSTWRHGLSWHICKLYIMQQSTWVINKLTKRNEIWIKQLNKYSSYVN